MPDHSTSKTTHSLRHSEREIDKSLDPKYQPMYDAVREATNKILDLDSLSLWMSVQAELQRYRLAQAYPVSTILHEAFLRGLKAIDKGKDIPYPAAWLRLTCRYIIKEKSRAKKKEVQIERVDLISEQSADEEEDLDDHLSAQLREVKKQFKRLPQLEQDIISLKVVDGLRWEAVQAQLVDRGHNYFSVEALRQRKHRILQQLRKHNYEVTETF